MNIESEIGDRARQGIKSSFIKVLRNVVRIEKFVSDSLRIFTDEYLVFPNIYYLDLTKDSNNCSTDDHSLHP